MTVAKAFKFLFDNEVLIAHYALFKEECYKTITTPTDEGLIIGFPDGSIALYYDGDYTVQE